jgi:SLAP domain-containing protein
MKKHFLLLVSLLLFLVGCSSNEASTGSDTGSIDLKAQEKLKGASENLEPLPAKLVILDNQAPFKEENAKKLLDAAMAQHPTIEAGVIDIVPLTSLYQGEIVSVLFFVRNGTENEITSKELEKMTLTVTDVTGNTIAEAPFILKPELLGTLKSGEVRALRYDFKKEYVFIKDYDFSKGYNAFIN